MILVKPSFEILEYPEDAVHRIAYAARTCYKSDGIGIEEDTKLVKHLILRGHHSCLEHEKVTVKIICDRGVSHELVRHRIASFSQESTRYCNYSKDKFGNQVTFVIPPWVSIRPGEFPITWDGRYGNIDYTKFELKEFEVVSHADICWFWSLAVAERDYMKLLTQHNWQPQQARSVLPNSLKTEIIITANLREWRHIFKLRAEGSAGKPHPQMLEIMCPMLRVFKYLIPVIFDDIKEMEA